MTRGLQAFFSWMALGPSEALAQQLQEPFGILPAEPQLLAAVAGAMVAGVATIPLILAKRRQARAASLEQAQCEAALERTEEVLAAAPDGFFRWDSDGSEYCSRRLAVLLCLPRGAESRYADVAGAFADGEAAVLAAAVAGLRENGLGFEMELPARDGRRIQISGIRATAAADGRWLADVLWMRDVTDASQDVDRLSHQATELIAERHRLQSLLDALPTPVWLRDDDLALRQCNRAYAAAVGAASPKLAVDTGAELVPGPAVREARAVAARARAAGEIRSDTFHVVVDGERCLVEISEVPLVKDNGGGMVTAGFATDRTPVEEAQAELSRHIAAHAEVLENLGTAIAIFSSDTRLIFHNAAFCRLWGLEQEWLADQPGYGTVLDTLRDRRHLPEAADYRAFREEELRRFTSLIAPVEDLLHLPDETTLRRVISPHPFGGLLFTYEDVTDRLALERSYNTTLAVHRETLDNLHEAVAVFGPDGRLRLFNPPYTRLWNLSSAELQSEPHVGELVEQHRAFFDASEWDRVRDTILGLFSDRIPHHGRVERADGAILDYASVPLPDGGVLKTWLDVSDSARVEKALRDRNDALRAADRLRSEFVANVSCEVRQPLNAVAGFAEILVNGYYGTLNSRQSDYARHILDAARGLQALFADILDLATIEAGQMTLQLNAFDIHTMLANVLALVREGVRAKQVKLHFDCPLDTGWMVADERRIKQALFNLLANAMKFTPPFGQITLAAQRDGDAIVFTVADTGIGIPPAELSTVFQSFSRGNSSEARQSGAGLGLSLVKSFVELHGGTIDIVSVPMEGTTVTCRFPAGPADVALSA